MPISDEVIELAPVRKTKKLFIILIAAAGLMAALAVTFLVLYFLKPNVTEEKAVVHGVTVDPSNSGLFSTVEGGEEKLYASIGHEYVFKSNISVRNDTNANVQWEWPHEDIEVIEQSESGEAYIKFKPRDNAAGKEVTIKARSQANSNKIDSITFTVVNQGAEDICVTKYGVSGGKQTPISNDSLNKPLAIEVPFYSTASNNKTYNVEFVQYGKYDASTDTHAKITAIKRPDGSNTNDVMVVASDASVIEIIQDSVSATGFSFNVKKATVSGPVSISIKANEKNDAVANKITKTISVTVKHNRELGYADGVYVFNKPVVTSAFIKDCLSSDNVSIDSQKLKSKLDADTALKVNFGSINNAATLTLPYSPSAPYTDIFSHIMINPLSIQYDYTANSLRDNWYKNIKVTSSNANVLTVTTDPSTGAVRLDTKGLAGAEATNAAKCQLTFTDSKVGSVGANMKIDVNIVAQNEKAVVKVGSAQENINSPGSLAVPAVPNDSYEVAIAYNFIIPGTEDENTLKDKKYINDSYRLVYDSTKMSVTYKGSEKVLAPNSDGRIGTEFALTKPAGSGSVATSTGTVTFNVTLKDIADGPYTFKFIKNGTTGDSGLDALWEKLVTFNVTRRATTAAFVSNEIGTAYITKNNTVAGNFVAGTGSNSETAYVYLQAGQSGEFVEFTARSGSRYENIKNLISTDAGSNYNVLVTVNSCNTTYLEQTGSADNGNELKFKSFSTMPTKDFLVAKVIAKVSDISSSNNVIKTLTINLYLVDGITGFEIDNRERVTYYTGTGSTSSNYTITENDVKAKHSLFTTAANYGSKYGGIDIYLDGDRTKKLTPTASGNDVMYSYESGSTDIQLYKYNHAMRKISPVDDIYKLSQNNGIDFSRLYIDFKLGAETEYVGKHSGGTFTYGGSMLQVTFSRRSDGVKLFTDDNYTAEITATVTGNTRTLSHRVNQGATCAIIVSSVIFFDSASHTVLADREYAAYDKAYITIPSGFSLIPNQSLSAGAANTYYKISFTAPDITAADAGGTHTYRGFGIYCEPNDTTHPNSLELIVEKVARGITEIGFYGDAACTDSQKLANTDNIVFGAFGKTGVVYERTIYVKIKYENYISRHTYFESAELTFPSYLQLDETSADTRIVRVSDNNYKLTSLSADALIQGYTNGDIFACKLILKTDSGKQGGTAADKVRVKKADSADATIKAENNVIVESGINSIAVTGDGVTNVLTSGATAARIDRTFALADKKDAKTFTLSLAYDTIANFGQYAIAYNTDRLDVVYPADVAGLRVSQDAKTSKTITISINSTDVRTMAATKLAFEFNDKADVLVDSTASVQTRVFKLDVYITVTMDIYKLAFADAGNSYDINTTNNSGTAYQETAVTVHYNDNDSLVAPSDDLKNRTTVAYIVKHNSANGKYERYTGNDIQIEKSGATYKLKVKNDINVTNGYTGYFVSLEYGSLDPVRRAIKISTLESRIELEQGEGSNNLTVTDGKASIVVDHTSVTTAKLAVVVKNKGTGAVDSTKTVTYGVYTDAGHTVNANVDGISVNGNGIITFAPKKPTGTVYFRAWFADTATGKTLNETVEITYTVKVEAVAVEGVDSTTMSGKTITLYYADNARYTYIDLSDKIVAKSNFAGVTIPKAETTGTVTCSSSFIHASGSVIKPLGITSASGVPVTVTARYGTTEKSDTYTVVVKAIGEPTLTQTGSLDVIAGGSLVIEPHFTAVAGFVPTYTLAVKDNNDRITIANGTGNIKTLSLKGRSAAQIGNYTMIATVEYAKNSGMSVSVAGVLAIAKEVQFTVGCTYTADFDLCNAEGIITAGGVVKHALGNNPTGYYISVNNTGHGDSVAAYTVSATDIIEIAAVSSNRANVTVKPDRSGAFSVTLNATVFGKAFPATKNYYFAYGVDPVIAIYGSSDGGATYTALNDTQDIGYTTQKFRIKYEIGGIDVNTVAASDINIVVGGGTAGSVTKSTDKYYVVIEAKEPTTMHIGGTLRLANRTVYLQQKSVTLTAVAPNPTIASQTSVIAGGSIDLSVDYASGFKGDKTVSYSVKSGRGYVTISGSRITANKNIAADQTITVDATVTITNGVYAGVYNIEKTITVIGVPLPTIAWNSAAPSTITAGVQAQYSSSHYALGNNGIVSYTSGSYDYKGKVTYAITASSGTLVSGVDYTFNGNTLVVNDTAKTKAGGSITLVIAATVNADGARGGERVSSELVVTVLPKAELKDITISNGKGSVNLNSTEYTSGSIKYISPYVYNQAGFVLPTDTFGVVSIAISGVVGTDASTFSTSGSNIIVNGNITASGVRFTATIKIVITSGAYKGYEITGELNVSVAIPTDGTPSRNVAFGADNEYASTSITHTGATGIQVAVTDASKAGLITIANNGGTSPSITVSKSANIYFAGGSGSVLNIPLGYTVTKSDGKAYYYTTQLAVAPVEVTVTGKVGEVEIPVSGLTQTSGASFIVSLSADKGFDVSVDSVSVKEGSTNSNDVQSERYANSVIFSVGTISAAKTLNVTIVTNVAERTKNYTFNLALALPSGESYTVTNTGNNDFAKNEAGAITSEWTWVTGDFKYGKSIKFKAPNGQNLSTYVSSISVSSTDVPIPTTGNDATYTFNNYHTGLTTHFNVRITFKTSAALPSSIITAEYLVYNGSRFNATPDTIIKQYMFRVVDDITVTLDNNSHGAAVTGNGGSVTLKYKSNYSGLPTSPTRTGYEFAGWYRNAACTGTAVINGAAMKDEHDSYIDTPHTLYAKWTPRTYNVTFNLNGATGTVPTQQTVTYDSTFSSIPATQNRTGYVFAGWYSSSTGGTLYTPDTKVTITSNITLYAHWTPTVWALKFHQDTGVSAVLYSMSVVYGKPYGALPTPSKDGFTFVGWFTSGNAEITASSTVNITADTDVYAHWTAAHRTVTLERNGGTFKGSWAQNTVDATIGSNYPTLPTSEQIEYAGHTFVGWFESLDGGTAITASTKYTGTVTVIYARWTVAVRTVTLERNGGTFKGEWTQNTVDATIGSNYPTLPTSAQIEYAGYTFAGWFESLDGGTAITASTPYNSAVTVLYARWTPITYTVTLIAGDGYVFGAAGSHTYAVSMRHGGSYDLHTHITPTREGYAFVGWKAASGTTVTAAFYVTEDVTLTAEWVAEYTVTLVDEVGDMSRVVKCRSGESYTLPTASATVAGKTFQGWSTVNNNADAIVSSSSVTVNANVKYYAVWQTSSGG